MAFSAGAGGTAAAATAAAISSALSSSAFASSSAMGKPTKLLQVDIYPLNAPPSHGAEKNDDAGHKQRDDITITTTVTNNTNAAEDDAMTADHLAQQLSTAVSLYDVEVPTAHCNNAADDHSSHSRPTATTDRRRIRIDRYRDGAQLAEIMQLIGSELSEPYSVYTYLYFIHQWPELCVLALDCADEHIVGAILCKLDRHVLDERDCVISRGYIGMLAVKESYRGHGIGTRLIRTIVELLRQQGCHEVVLETEVTNARSLSLYGRLGFIRDARLFRYYLNGGDAFRLKLFLDQPPPPMPPPRSPLAAHSSASYYAHDDDHYYTDRHHYHPDHHHHHDQSTSSSMMMRIAEPTSTSSSSPPSPSSSSSLKPSTSSSIYNN